MTTPSSTSNVSQKDVLAGIGVVSALGLYISLLLITIYGGGNYTGVLHGIIQLVTGNAAAISNSGESMMQTIITIVAVVLITLPIAAVVGGLVSGKTKSYDYEMIDRMLDKGPFALFSIVALEEIVTRGLFLGLLTKVFTGEIGFYAMFLLGNALWAFVHIYNFKDKEEQSILRVAPQFIGGIAFTYVFVLYGLFAAIMAHYLYNTILLATRKEKMPNGGTLFTFVYYVVLLLIIWLVMAGRDISIADLMTWVTENVVPLSGYSFWDYAVVLLAVDALVGIAAALLLLDTTDGNRETLDMLNNNGGFLFVISVILLALINAGIILLLNWLLGYLVSSIITRSIAITVVLAMLAKSRSGSSLAKATLVNLPGSFFTIAAFVALGFWSAVGLSLVFFLVHYVPLYVNSD